MTRYLSAAEQRRRAGIIADLHGMRLLGDGHAVCARCGEAYRWPCTRWQAARTILREAKLERLSRH